MATLELTSAQLNAWIGAYLWPFTRMAALIGAAPVFGTRTVPARVRLAIALLLTLAIVPALPPVPTVDPLSGASVAITVQQVLIGLALGFGLRLAFAALEMAGEVIGQLMGLGFASLLDPQNGVPVPAVGQFYTLLAVLLFFAFNGHWVLIEILVGSFRTVPIGPTGLGAVAFYDIALLGGYLFVGALAIALPMIAALLLVNIAFGVMTRAAPQINIFAVGFPIMLLLGFVVMLVALPLLPTQWSSILDHVFGVLERIARGA